MNEPIAAVSANGEVSGVDICTRKTAACAVSLGVAIMREIIGRDISNVATENAHEIIATSINNELKI
jgi:hypothetical protein